MDTTHWQNKTVEELSLHELAYAHLGHQGVYRLKDGLLRSVLPTVLREVNHSRHLEYSKNFVPIVGAFGIIEQIGFAYKRSDMEAFKNKDASCIKKALYYFASYPENSEDIKALYALRNSFLHNASLMAKAQFKNQPNYFFQFDRDIETIAMYPQHPWDGNIETFSYQQTTIVNPEKIIDLAFTVVDKARDCLDQGTLEVNLESGEIELYYRYLKVIRD
ncbi:hypothetical protein [Marinomonas fungiae]|uniref:Uncharacterized protein n=1 Tax=Marinomonas fungiae TaxID=1137284 RepID=A0A0K6IJ76_9GAMM|nr:hypothetical protein [Marinomonas fungiae]CUB03155.1 hypothetical protein Ga0061065_1033 [Marinomonas fungiae]